MSGVGGLFPGIRDFSTPIAMFHAKKSVGQAIGAATFTRLIFDYEVYDLGKCYNPSTYRWTPPPGYVWIAAGAAHLPNNNVHYLMIYKNGLQQFQNGRRPYNSGFTNNDMAHFYDWANGTDYYEVFYYSWLASTINANDSYFEGYVSPTHKVLLKDYERDII